MARLSQQDAQGHGDIRSWFGFPKAVSNAVTAVKSYVSPREDLTKDSQIPSTTPPTPASPNDDARTEDTDMRYQVGNNDLKSLSNGFDRYGITENAGEKRANTSIGTFSPYAKRSPNSHTSTGFSSSESVRTKKSVAGSFQNTETKENKLARELQIELNGSPRVARKRMSNAPSPLPSPTKPRPGKRQNSSNGSGTRKEQSAELEPRLSTPRILEWYKEPQPGSRSSSRAKRVISKTKKREALFVGQDKENEVHKYEEHTGILEGSLVSKRALKRKRDEPAQISRTPPSRSQPKRDAKSSSSHSSPSRSITKMNSSRALKSLEFAESSSPSDSSAGSLGSKRKRDFAESVPGIRSSPGRNPALSPNPTALEAPEPVLPTEMPRQRSASISSNKTIEDVLSPREDVSRQLWPAAQSEKGSRDREVLSSPPSTEPIATTQAPSLSYPSMASTSFSSLLRSSQPSKRVVSHGQEVVLGSDDDSEDSLPDVGVLFKKKKPNPAPKAQVDEVEPKPKYTFSMKALLQEEKQAKAADARIEAAKSRLQTYSKPQLEQNGQIVTNKSVMACLVENGDQDEGSARRVKEALRRTEILDYHNVWHFFNEEPPARMTNAFPKIKISNRPLASILNDPAKRQQAVITGFLTRLAAHTALPKEVMLWMIEEVCREPKEILVQSYISVLEASIARHEQLVTPTRIDSLFKQLGATETVFTPDCKIPASKEPVGIEKRPISSRVRALVYLIERLAFLITVDSRKRAFHLLALAIFDDSVIQDCHLAVRIEAAIDKLLQTIPDEDFEQEILDMGGHLFKTVKPAVLRHQLIAALPCYSSRSHRFRRQLALAFALRSAKHLESSLENPKTISHVLLSLQNSKHFHVTKKTNWTVMEAYFGMLDVAVDAGFSAFDFTENPRRDSGPSAGSEGVKKNPFAARAARKAAMVNVKEDAFNEEIDGLTREVRDIMSLVLDSGASDLSRTECKATAARFVERLENGVRTKIKPAKDYYQRNEQGQGLMRDFVKREGRKEDGDGDVGKGEAKDGEQTIPGDSAERPEIDQSTSIDGEDVPDAQEEVQVALGLDPETTREPERATPPLSDKHTDTDIQQKTPPHSGRQEV